MHSLICLLGSNGRIHSVESARLYLVTFADGLLYKHMVTMARGCVTRPIRLALAIDTSGYMLHCFDYEIYFHQRYT